MLNNYKIIKLLIFCTGIFIISYLIAVNTGDKNINNEENFETVSVYFVDIFTNSLVAENRRIPTGDIYSKVEFVLGEFMSPSTVSNHINIIPNWVKIEGFTIENNTDVVIRFSKEYRDMTLKQEVLGRSALVWTLTSIEDIENVRVYVEDEELLMSTGYPLGNLNRSNVILNPQVVSEEVEINTRMVSLYFGNESLTGLIEEQRMVNISSDRPIEEQIFEELLKGPETEGLYSYIPVDTRLIDVNTTENISFIDLSSEFDVKHPMGEKAQELAVYSIVNSLTQIPELMVKEVQFLIEAQKLNDYNGYIDLSQPFTRNEDLIIKP